MTPMRPLAFFAALAALAATPVAAQVPNPAAGAAYLETVSDVAKLIVAETDRLLAKPLPDICKMKKKDVDDTVYVALENLQKDGKVGAAPGGFYILEAMNFYARSCPRR